MMILKTLVYSVIALFLFIEGITVIDRAKLVSYDRNGYYWDPHFEIERYKEDSLVLYIIGGLK